MSNFPTFPYWNDSKIPTRRWVDLLEKEEALERLIDACDGLERIAGYSDEVREFLNALAEAKAVCPTLEIPS